MEDTNLSAKEVFNKIINLKGSKIISRIKTPNKNYPFFKIKVGQGKRVLISGGLHGDEPAGVFTIIEFFKKHAADYLDKFEFTAFPCVNPFGFENNTHPNAEGLNLNRQFKKNTASPETKLIMRELEEYVFTMDFHEDWVNDTLSGEEEPVGDNPENFYLWELCADKSIRAGSKIIENIKRAGLPVCEWPTIYGDINSGGVIFYPEGCRAEC